MQELLETIRSGMGDLLGEAVSEVLVPVLLLLALFVLVTPIYLLRSGPDRGRAEYRGSVRSNRTAVPDLGSSQAAVFLSVDSDGLNAAGASVTQNPTRIPPLNTRP
jgi:hypothetical protein